MQIGLGVGITNASIGGAAALLGVPAGSAQTLSLPFDGTLGAGSRTGGIAWNPETGLINPHNFIPQSETFNVAAWTKGTGVTNPAANSIAYAGGGVANQSLIYNSTGKLIPVGEKWALILYYTAITDSYFKIDTNSVSTSVAALAGSSATVVLPITGDGTNTHYAQLKATATNQSMNITAAFMFCRVDNITGLPWPYILTTSAAVYLPRYVSGKSGQAVLVEEASTNLLLQSNNFNDATWVKTAGTSVTALNLPAFDGTNIASQITFTNGFTDIKQAVSIAAGTTLTGSIYIKGVAGETIQVGSNVSATLITLNGQWQRAQHTSVSTGVSHTLFIGTWSGATARVVSVCIPQLEALPYATSPIVTGATPVTRLADVVTHPTAGYLTAAQGTISMWVKAQSGRLTAASNTVVTLFDHISTGTNNRITLYDSNAIYALVSDSAGTTNLRYYVHTWTDGWHHLAMSWVAGSFPNLYVNGASVSTGTGGTNTSVPSALGTNMFISCDYLSTNQADMPIDALRIWNRPLTAAEVLQVYRAGR